MQLCVGRFWLNFMLHFSLFSAHLPTTTTAVRQIAFIFIIVSDDIDRCCSLFGWPPVANWTDSADQCMYILFTFSAKHKSPKCFLSMEFCIWNCTVLQPWSPVAIDCNRGCIHGCLHCWTKCAAVHAVCHAHKPLFYLLGRLHYSRSLANYGVVKVMQIQMQDCQLFLVLFSLTITKWSPTWWPAITKRMKERKTVQIQFILNQFFAGRASAFTIACRFWQQGRFSLAASVAMHRSVWSRRDLSKCSLPRSILRTTR